MGIGFTSGPPKALTADFVTTTSKRADATVTTYGRGLTDVVEVVAQAETKAAVPVLGAVATTPLSRADGTRALAWVRAEVAKGPLSATKPRSTEMTYGGQRYQLLVTSSTATLTIGRLRS